MRSSIQIKLLLLRFFLFTASVIWLTGIISPCLDIGLFRALYPFQKQVYSIVCHQDINKSFNCSNIYFLVCARCSGIYLGSAIISLAVILVNRPIKIKTKLLVLLSLPLLADVLFTTIKLYNYNKLLSAITGLLFGSIVFLYILSAIENLLLQKKIHEF
ncbi:MAG: DUF2085 domain-containing protein [Ignavibacteriota bacterium]|nr:DUF2085 domain-containing protein [Ignavibacterium album]MEB2355462.1 DUF2085 domain-containing protein [Ignavibacteriales bacterium]QKJ99439.1 MAG: DUF2085 domain-containing protein [Ignavibacteriota bacterium]HOJ06844.1 DUF2085 domain-containing protein [Ignavibacteriaceae bacterium]